MQNKTQFIFHPNFIIIIIIYTNTIYELIAIQSS
jgi:hypothetical protein